jgi:hypothetical protein
MIRSRARMVAPLAVMLAALLATAAPVSAAATRIGQFPLKGSLANTVATNLKLTKLGSPSFATAAGPNGDPRKLLVVEEGEGLELSRIPKAARGSYTIEVVLKPDQVSDYERILSFGPNDVDAGLYFDDGVLYLYPEKYIDSDTLIVDGEWVRVRVARNGDTGRMQVFWETDASIGLFTYMDTAKDFRLRNGIVRLFQDDGSEHFSGSVARITIWKGYLPVKLGID